MKIAHAPLRSLLRFWHTAALVPALLAVSSASASSQVLLEENFAFTGPLTSNGWTAVSGSGTNPITAVSPGLTYPNLPSSGIGNVAAIGTTGEDDRKLLTAPSTSGDVYASCLISVSAAQAAGDYFYTFSSGTTGFIGRVFARSSGAGFVLGIQKGTGTTPTPAPTYSTTVLNFNTTYLLVLKVKRNSGSTTDDEASIWVDPVLGAVETAPLVTNNQGNDQSSIDSIVLRQGNASNAPTVKLGNILVGTTWAAVTPSASLPVISPSGAFSVFSTFAGTASASQSLVIGAANLTAGITATAPTGFQVSSDNVTFGPTASLPASGGTLYARVAASAAGGEVSTSITLSSAGATDVSVPVTAAVRPNSVALPYGPETFTTSSFPWYTYTVAGTKNWIRSSAGGNSFMEINGYDVAPGALPANSWLILGPFNFPPSASNLVASFNLQRAFNDAGSDAEFTFKYSADYAGIGDPSTATWSEIPFTKPAAVASSSTVFTPSGAVSLPSSLAGQNGVYVAFQLAASSATATSRWRVDDFELFTSSLPVISVVVNPSTIDEGSTASGTVSIPEAVGSEVTVTVTSADPTRVLVDNGYGEAPAASSQVPIFAGETSATFNVTTTRDFQPGPDVPVQITADGGAAYTFGQTIVTVRNIDLPAASLTGAGYTQSFAGFTSQATLPLGWSITPSNQTYSEWANTTAGAKFSSPSVNVFGYQHTGSTGSVQQLLTLRNDTTETITDVVISYLGRVARSTEGRTPSYVVRVGGIIVPALAYSTATGSDATVTAAITGLSVAPNQTFSISWTSDGSEVGSPGSGTRRQIGIGELSVTIGSAILPPSVTSLTIPLANIGQTSAGVRAEVTGDGGSAITGRGFVYALTSANPNPTIGGTGVTNVPDASAELGEFTATLSDLTGATQYSVAAYAVNAEGTTYTPARTFTTLGAPIAFTGNYEESFATYTGTLPAGWTALSSAEIQVYGGDWGTGSSAGFRGVGTNTGAVLGYQPTTTSGTLTVTARFVNNTGSTIENLNVSYLGRVARPDQSRTPTWAVTVAGIPVEALVYSTGNTAGPEGAPADLELSSQLSGLSIAPGTEFSVTWFSPNPTGSGASRQIGLADFVITTGSTPPPNPYNNWAGGFGLNPSVTTGPTAGAPAADPDGDSFTNAQEYAFGTNPTQGTSSLLSTTASGGNLVVTWLQRSDVTYNVQSTANLATTAFANDGTVTVVAGPTDPAPPAGYTRKQISVPASGSKFYRVTGSTP